MKFKWMRKFKGMRFNKLNKRASLELSIQSIVIVVIAFVVLGLGLGFVRSQFKDIQETSKGVQEQIRQQILEDLRTGDKKLSFPATTLQIEKGDAQDIGIGVKNVLNGDLRFTIELAVTDAQHKEYSSTELQQQVQFFFNSGPFTLKTTDVEAYNIKITAAGDKGTYLINLRIKQEGSDVPYAEKSFFVNVI